MNFIHVVLSLNSFSLMDLSSDIKMSQNIYGQSTCFSFRASVMCITVGQEMIFALVLNKKKRIEEPQWVFGFLNGAFRKFARSCLAPYLLIVTWKNIHRSDIGSFWLPLC